MNTNAYNPGSKPTFGTKPHLSIGAPAGAHNPTGGGNKPLAKFKAGAVIATVWANNAQGASGEVTYHSISLDRRYQDKAGAWQSTSSMRVNDLPKAALVLQKAYEHLVIRESGEAAVEKTPRASSSTIGILEEEALVA